MTEKVVVVMALGEAELVMEAVAQDTVEAARAEVVVVMVMEATEAMAAEAEARVAPRDSATAGVAMPLHTPRSWRRSLDCFR